MEHAFTATIKAVLQKNFGAQADELFERSLLLQYLNLKTRSANRGSKSRSSFANLYALFVLAEDYLKGGFDKAAIIPNTRARFSAACSSDSVSCRSAASSKTMR